MDGSQRRYAAEAWAMLEELSKLRKSVYRELDFLHSISPAISPGHLEAALSGIDDFCLTISSFLTKIQSSGDRDLDADFEQLDGEFQSVCAEIRHLLDR